MPKQKDLRSRSRTSGRKDRTSRNEKQKRTTRPEVLRGAARSRRPQRKWQKQKGGGDYNNKNQKNFYNSEAVAKGPTEQDKNQREKRQDQQRRNN